MLLSALPTVSVLPMTVATVAGLRCGKADLLDDRLGRWGVDGIAAGREIDGVPTRDRSGNQRRRI
jgi:hypothetical protein